MAAFCRRHGYRGGEDRRTAADRLRARTGRRRSACPPTTLTAIISAQIQLLRAVQATIAEIEKRIAGCVAAHPRARLLAALPGVGTINLAQLLAEVGPILDRVESAEQAATECGAAPVTKASGKSQRGLLPLRGQHAEPARPSPPSPTTPACNHPGPASSMPTLDRRGKRNPHAVRIVARAWLRVIWACWHTGNPYDPATHARTPATDQHQQLDSGNSSATSPARSTGTSLEQPPPPRQPPSIQRRLDEHRSIERFQQTLDAGGPTPMPQPIRDRASRALPAWIHDDNHHRTHSAIGGRHTHQQAQTTWPEHHN